MTNSRRRKQKIQAFIPTPSLKGICHDDTAIIWSWEASPEYCYALVDEQDRILTRLPYGKDRYVETGLKPGQTYLRKLAAYNNDASSGYSELVSVTTKSTYEALVSTPFEPLLNDTSESSVLSKDVISDNLMAFQSGVGYGLDLKVEKQSLDEYRESFALSTKVEGVFTQRAKKYTEIPFSYRVKASAKYYKESTEGFVELKTTAYDKAELSFDVFRYATASLNIKARVRFEVEYYVTKYGEITAHRKTMYSKELSHDLNQKDKVVYDAKAGNVYLKRSSVKLSDQTVRELIEEAILADSSVNPYHQLIPCHVYGVVIEDDYPYSSVGDDVWKFGSKRDFFPTGTGTINVLAKPKGTSNDLMDCCLHLEGFARSGLYSGFKRYEKTVDSLEREVVVALSNAELKNIPIKNVDDPSYSFQFSLSEITSDIRNIELKTDRKDRVQVSYKIPDSVSNDPVVIVRFSDPATSKTCTYRYSDTSFRTVLPYYKHVSGITQTPIYEYLFVTEILNCSDNVTINGEKIKKGMIYKQTGTPIDHLEILTTPFDKVYDWEMMLPNPTLDAPLNGIVNNGSQEINGGKKDYFAYVPKFPLPERVVSETLLYQVMFESLNDEESMVSSKFTDGSFYTQKMGGMITFSSEAFTYQDVQLKNTVSEETFHPLEINGLSETTYVLDLTKNKNRNDLFDVPYMEYRLSVQSNNNDVIPTDYPLIIEFDDEGRAKVEVKCRIQQNAVSKWSPRIHSGYYYINQHEYFMPSEFMAETDLTDENTFAEETFDVNVHALVKQSMPITRVTEKWTQPNEYYATTERHPQFTYYLTPNDTDFDQWIEVTPIIDTAYYKKYQNATFISPVKTLENVIDVYGQLRWKQEVSKDVKLTPYIRAFDLDRNLWSGWVLVKEGYAIEGLPSSNLIQLKFDCELKQTETTETFTDIYNCAYDFDRIMSIQDSSNVETVFDVIRGDNPTKEAVYVTQVIDRGVPVASSFSGQGSNQGTIEYYIATSNSKEVLLANPQWRNCAGASFTNEERFVRYKIVIPAYEEVYDFVVQTKTRTLSQVQARFGNFQLEGRKEGAFRYEECHRRISYTRLNDGKVSLLESSIEPLLTEMAESEGYEFKDVYEFYLTSGSANFELQYDLANPQTALYARSVTLNIHDAEVPLIKFENNRTIIKGIPQQFSPVVVEHPTLGPFREVPALNGENKTFACQYDWLGGRTIIEVCSDEPFEEAFVSFETSLLSSYKPLTHLSLNPIYNIENEGFIYISYEQPVPTQLHVSANPTVFLPYREDHTSIYLQLTDKHDNPVPGKLIQVGQTIGKIDCDNYTTDQNGVVVLRYHSPKGTGIEKVNFTVANHPGIEASVTITIAEPSY